MREANEMLQVLGWTLLALSALIGLIMLIWVNIWNSRVPERPDPPSEETKDPFAKPESLVNSSTRDHVHMVSGTIYEIRNPEHDGRSMAEVSNSILESLNGSPAAPGVVVRTVTDEQEWHELRAKRERESLSRCQTSQNPKPEVTRKSRYKRSLVI